MTENDQLLMIEDTNGSNDLLSSIMNTDINFYFDMDGVLANFDKGVEMDPKGEEFAIKKKILFDYLEANYPDREVKELSTDAAKLLLCWNNRDLAPYFDDVKSLLDEIMDQRGFFASLEPMEGVAQMLEAAKEINGKLPNILTSPADTPWCGEEKKAWMAKHFNGMYDTVIVEKEKEKYATSRHDVLIDDRWKLTDKFSKAGGSIILHKDPVSTIEQMRKHPAR